MENSLTIGTILKGSSYTYRIERILGQGSFGITYLATTKVKVSGALGDLETTMKVAVKEFFMKDINEREGTSVTCGSKGGIYDNYRKKFAREARNLSHLQHPHIIKVLESFESNNTVYYAMEYCEGGSLDMLIRNKGRLGEKEALPYLAQIASALTFMHEHKMLHLDLKPANVMLRANGEVALIDFGLSKQYDEQGVPESSTTVGGGTPGYAPIEQSNYREGKDFPVTMDVYALGATLYKMLTGMRPADASAMLNDGFPEAALKELGITDGVISCVEKAMAPTKRMRYQTVHELVDEYSGALGAGRYDNVETKGECIEEGTEFMVPDDVKPVETLVNEPESGKTPEKPKRGSSFIKNNWLTGLAVLLVLAGGIVLGNVFSGSRDEGHGEETIENKDTAAVTVSDTTASDIPVPTSPASAADDEPVVKPDPTPVKTPAVKPKPTPQTPVQAGGVSDKEPEPAIVQKPAEPMPEPEPAPEQAYLYDNAVPYEKVQIDPMFMGGDANSFVSWVNSQLVYPDAAMENGIEGRVTVQFTVGTDGSVGRVKVLYGAEPSLDAEAVRVVRSSPKWVPGKHKGNVVPVVFSFSVNFNLNL